MVVLWENKEVTSKWRPEGEAEAEREAGEAGKGNLGKREHASMKAVKLEPVGYL